MNPGCQASVPRYNPGAEMGCTLGTAIFAGMIGVTLFGIFLTPVFYYIFRWFSGPVKPRESPLSTNPEN